MSEDRFDELREVFPLLDDGQLRLVGGFVRLLGSPEAACDTELGEVAVSAFEISAAAKGAAVPWLRRFEGSTAWAVDGAKSPAKWLDSYAEVSKSHAGFELRRARRLASLPVLEAALAAGALGPEKVQLVLDVEKKIPEQVREHEQYLVDQLSGLTVEGAHRFLTTWFEKVRPQVPDDDSADGTPPDGGENHIDRAATLGGTHVTGFLDPEHAAVIFGATEAEIDAWFRDGLLDGDTRNRGQLTAAALCAIAQRYGSAGEQHAQARPLALVLADADTLASRVASAGSPNMDPVCEIVGHGPISPDTARRLLCGADTSRVILRGRSEVLDVGMRQRLATPAQRRGLIAAAGGRCEFPGCDAPPHWCQVHHLDPFDPKTATGPTDMANLALVCHRHHHAVHEGKFKMARAPNGITVHRPDGTLLVTTKHHRPGPNTPRDG